MEWNSILPKDLLKVVTDFLDQEKEPFCFTYHDNILPMDDGQCFCATCQSCTIIMQQGTITHQ